MSTSFHWCILHSRVCIKLILGGNPANTYSMKSQSHPSHQVPHVIMSHLNTEPPHTNSLQALKSHHYIMFHAETRQRTREMEIWGHWYEDLVEEAVHDWTKAEVKASLNDDIIKLLKVIQMCLKYSKGWEHELDFFFKGLCLQSLCKRYVERDNKYFF